MEKLELKHLAPYLPYGLKYKSLMNNRINEVEGLHTDFNSNYWGIKIKPILRPLSDLTKEFIDKNKILDSMPCGHYLGFNIEIDTLNQMLFKHHFDVFELITKGLAIDINTLKKSPLITSRD